MDGDKDVATVRKQEVKATVTAMEVALKREKDLRAAKSGQLLAKQNELIDLMDDDCNLEMVKTKLHVEFNHLFGEFCDLNISVKRLFVSAEDMKSDQQCWFEPQANSFREFIEQVVTWIKDVHGRMQEARKVIDNVYPSDSISVAASQKNKKSKPTSGSSYASSVRLKAELEKATLMAQLARLNQKHALEEQEAKLEAEREALKIPAAVAKLKAKKQEFDIHHIQAKMKVSWKGSDMLRDREPALYVGSQSVASDRYGSTSIRNNGRNNAPPFPSATGYANNFGSAANSPSVTVRQHQKDTAAFLVKQQKLPTQPAYSIPIFTGDPLEYKAFINAFQLGVESQTDSSIERLFYMEQYTSGKPKDLIRHCLRMDPDQGYSEAKRLLKERFGNEYRISVAYINKALSWPTIKAGDGEALQAFALFLISCDNVMMNTEYKDEMDTLANMWAIVNKLPYKLRDEWRSFASELQEIKARRPKFKDLVKFIDTKARVTIHPAFRVFRDSGKGRPKSSVIFTKTTAVSPMLKPTKRVPTCTVSAFTKPCLFCHGEHSMVQCKKMKRSLHKEKLDFLRGKGLCFSCLKQGHLSKFCEEKLNCEVCSLKHPTVLHMKSKDRAKPKDEWSEDGEKHAVISGFVDTAGKICSGSEASNTLTILAIVPVQVKAKKGNKVATSYALLDTGSTASFCTQELMNELNLHGNRINLRLTTVGEQNTIPGCVVTGVEVSSLDGCDFIELREVFCLATIPVNKRNIPLQEDVDRWPHLKQVRIPHIDAPIGLLVGANVPKAMEPVELIKSINDGPYAVRTVLGWTVSGPLREDNHEAARSEVA